MNAADTSAWQGASSLRVTSSRVRCRPLVLLPLQMRETLGAHHRAMAPFIPLWNECRRHLGLAGRLQPSRHVESGAMRTACSLAPSDALLLAQPRRLIAAANQPMRLMLGLQPRRSRAAEI